MYEFEDDDDSYDRYDSYDSYGSYGSYESNASLSGWSLSRLSPGGCIPRSPISARLSPRASLSLAEYRRYSRQLILPSIGLPGQLRLKSFRVLVIGAGGLGCPALLYLTSSGFGTIGIMDGDTVEESNLHRQILHTRAGISKVDSAIEYLQRLNPHVRLRGHRQHISPENGAASVRGYDLVLDCTDRPFTRYLISDVCRARGIGLISGAAIRSDGQLLVLTDVAGPCYRCIFPREPAQYEACSEAGVMPGVVGTIGAMMAQEALQRVVRGTATRMVVWNGETWRAVRLRGRQPGCGACSGTVAIARREAGVAAQNPGTWRVQWREVLVASLGEGAGEAGSGAGAGTGAGAGAGAGAGSGAGSGTVGIPGTLPGDAGTRSQTAGLPGGLPARLPGDAGTPAQTAGLPGGLPRGLPGEAGTPAQTQTHTYTPTHTQPHTQPQAALHMAGTLVDVRTPTEFGLCSVRGSVNMPLEAIAADEHWTASALLPPLYLLCHHGNDSQAAVRLLRARGTPCVDIEGGIDALALLLPGFPRY